MGVTVWRSMGLERRARGRVGQSAVWVGARYIGALAPLRSGPAASTTTPAQPSPSRRLPPLPPQQYRYVHAVLLRLRRHFELAM